MKRLALLLFLILIVPACKDDSEVPAILIPVYLHDASKGGSTENYPDNSPGLTLPTGARYHINDGCISFPSGLKNGETARNSQQNLFLYLQDSWGPVADTAAAFIEFGQERLQMIRSDDCFFTSFRLSPGPNSFYISIIDADGVLACSGIWTVYNTAVDALNADTRYTVVIDELHLGNFPLVTINLSVLSSGEHVSGLTEDNFILVNAGKKMAFAVSETFFGYQIQFTDICCGQRALLAYVQDRDISAAPRHAGVSEPLYYGTNRALLVGINTYPEPSTCLKNCINDMTDMKAVLESSPYWQTPEACIKTLTDAEASQAAVISELTSLANVTEPWDLMLFFFSGHGSSTDSDLESRQYLCTSENPPVWISVDDLAAIFSKFGPSGPANAFVFLDACHSGNFIDKALTSHSDSQIKYLPLPDSLKGSATASAGFSTDLKSLSGSNVMVMTAAAGDQAAYDVSELNNGAFSYFLTEGLGLDHDTQACGTIPAAPGNMDHNTHLAGEEVFKYLAGQIDDSFSQTPQLGDNDSLHEAIILNLW